MNPQPPACIDCQHRNKGGSPFVYGLGSSCKRRESEWRFDPVMGRMVHDGTAHPCAVERAAPGLILRALALVGLAPDRCGPAGRYFQQHVMPAPPTGISTIRNRPSR